jgi:hypothetical protein
MGERDCSLLGWNFGRAVERSWSLRRKYDSREKRLGVEEERLVCGGGVEQALQMC